LSKERILTPDPLYPMGRAPDLRVEIIKYFQEMITFFRHTLPGDEGKRFSRCYPDCSVIHGEISEKIVRRTSTNFSVLSSESIITDLAE
jgi:hypothetical protein